MGLPQYGEHLVALKIIRERLLRSAPNEDEIAAVMRDSEVVIITTKERGYLDHDLGLKRRAALRWKRSIEFRGDRDCSGNGKQPPVARSSPRAQ